MLLIRRSRVVKWCIVAMEIAKSCQDVGKLQLLSSALCEYEKQIAPTNAPSRHGISMASPTSTSCPRSFAMPMRPDDLCEQVRIRFRLNRSRSLRTHLSKPSVSSPLSLSSGVSFGCGVSDCCRALPLPLPWPFPFPLAVESAGDAVASAATNADVVDARALRRPRYLPLPHPASTPRLPFGSASKKSEMPGQGCALQFARDTAERRRRAG